MAARPERVVWLASLGLLACALVPGCILGPRLADGKQVEIPSGGSVQVPFTVAEAGTVHFSAESTNDTPFEVCVVQAPTGGASTASRQAVRPVTHSGPSAMGFGGQSMVGLGGETTGEGDRGVNGGLEDTCHANVRQASGAVDLPSGEWALSLHCPGLDPCKVDAQAFQG